MTDELTAHEPSRGEVEAGYLASCIMFPLNFIRTADRARDELFTINRHKELLTAIRAMPTDQSWDDTYLRGWLKDHGKLEAVGGVTYLSEIMTFGIGSAESYLDLLESYYAKGEIRELCRTGLNDTDTPGAEMLDKMESEIIGIHQRLHREGGFVKLSEVIPIVMNTIEKRMATGRPVTGIPTGFYDLDNLTCGLQPGDLVVVAGYPSRGKSVLAEQISFNSARLGFPTLFFSLEMSMQNVMDRAFARFTGATLLQIRSGISMKQYVADLSEAGTTFGALPFWLDATPGMDLSKIVARARIAELQYHVKMVVVDYLQLIVGKRAKGDSQESEISETVRQLKNLARELNAPVVLLSQLRRPPSGARDPEPYMQDLKGSGGIESHADVVILLHRPNFEESKAKQLPMDDAEFIVAKQRNGPLGKVKVRFDCQHVQFVGATNIPEVGITEDGRLDESPDDIPGGQ